MEFFGVRMGIPGFKKWAQKVFTKAWLAGNQLGKVGRIDHVYLDLNGFFHTLARRSRSEADLWVSLFRKLDSILAFIKPRVSVYLVVDGCGTYYFALIL